MTQAHCMQSKDHFKGNGAEAASNILQDNTFTSGHKQMVEPASSAFEQLRAEHIENDTRKARNSPESPKYRKLYQRDPN